MAAIDLPAQALRIGHRVKRRMGHGLCLDAKTIQQGEQVIWRLRGCDAGHKGHIRL
jgi:hypothetical protein